MKTYKLLKDLPTFKAGTICRIAQNGNLITNEECISAGRMVYCHKELQAFPNILKDWFGEIPEQPKTVWDLECGDDIWVIGEGRIFDGVWGCADYSPERDAGDVFLIREDAEKELARRKAKVILERDTKGFRPNWIDLSQEKWSTVYNHLRREFETRWGDRYQHMGMIYFATESDVDESLKVHRKEWLTVLGVEE